MSDLSPPVVTDLLGHVDDSDPKRGIRGWAVDRDRPDVRLTVALMVNDIEIAQAETGFRREDAAATEQLPTDRIGFQFPPEAFYAFCKLGPEFRDHRPEVREVRSGRLVPGAQLPSVAACVKIAETQQSEHSLAGRATDFGPMDAALEALCGEAFVLAGREDAARGSQVGHIEAFCRIDTDTIAVIGWFQGTLPSEFPAFVAQEHEIAAGIVMATYERVDLPEGGRAFLALMRTSWAPELSSARFDIVVPMPGGGSQYLAVVEQPNHPNRADMVRWIDVQLERSPEQRLVRAMRGYVSAELARAEATTAGPEQAHIDQALVIPNFGLFATGWLLTGARRVETVSLLAGEAVARAKMGSFLRAPRPDLAEGFSGIGDEVSTAGFTGFFRGDVEAGTLGNAVIRLTYEDGGAAERPLTVSTIGQVRGTQDLEKLRAFYPQIQTEPFFPALRLALSRVLTLEVRARPLEDAAGTADPAPSLVIDLGTEGSDVQAVLEALHRHAADWPVGARLVLLCCDQTPRTAVQSWAQALRKDGVTVALLRVAPTHGLLHLPQVAASLPFEQVAYLKPGAIPKAAGWQAIFAHLTSAAPDDPSILAARGAHAGLTREALLAGVLWDGAALVDWAQKRQPRCAQDYLAALMTEAGAPTLAANAAFVVPRIDPPLFVRRLDSTAFEGA